MTAAATAGEGEDGVNNGDNDDEGQGHILDQATGQTRFRPLSTLTIYQIQAERQQLETEESVLNKHIVDTEAQLDALHMGSKKELVKAERVERTRHEGLHKERLKQVCMLCTVCVYSMCVWP